MFVTVSGPAGVGKSTTAAALADQLSHEHISGGDIFRTVADERGLTALELNQLAEEDDAIDRALDRRQRTIAKERGDVVLESRLAGWMAGEHADIKIWLDAPLSVRVARIADREDKSTDRAGEETEARAASEAHRYSEYYGIDITDRSIYDLTLSTARWNPDAIVRVLAEACAAYDPATDEGQVSVDIDVER
jgi:cytidylate kinase